MKTLLLVTVYGGALFLILQYFFDILGFLIKKSEPIKKSKGKNHQESITFKKNQYATSVLKLFEAIDNERTKLPPLSSQLSLDIDPNVLGNQFLDMMVPFIKQKWEQKHFDSFHENFQKGDKAEGFVLNFITHQAADILESDVILMVDKFKAARVLFEHSINRCILLCIYTKEWAEENLRKPVNKRSMIRTPGYPWDLE